MLEIIKRKSVRSDPNESAVSGGILSLGKRRKHLFIGNRIGYVYIAPAFLFLLAIMGFPILFSIFISFQNYNLETLISGKVVFVGLKNYEAIFQAPAFWTALNHSAIFTIASIFFQFTLGLIIALLFVRSFPLSNTMRGLMLSGWQIPSVVTGTVFLWIFNLDYGVFNRILMFLNLIKEPVGWLVQGNTALIAVIITNIWLGIPFNVIILTAGITGLPEDVYEAATVDGASYFQQLTYITIPLLKSTILAVLMLGFIYTMRVFDIIWIMTRGGPADATEVLPTFAYRLSLVHFDFGQSAAVATVILLILFVAAFFYAKNAALENM
ncbi:MAG TPA: sugar ABC transporter permease [Anaerolineales bacterium]